MKKRNTRTDNFLTFLSKTSLNSIISIITKMMKKKMLAEILEARIFSIERFYARYFHKRVMFDCDEVIQ